MVRSVSLLFAVLLMSGAALAQTYPQQDTPEDRACRFDARHFCKDDIPDQFKVGSCLQAHKDKLDARLQDRAGRSRHVIAALSPLLQHDPEKWKPVFG